MKKFKFTLQSLQYVKETQEKQTRAEMLKLSQQLAALNRELLREEQRFEEASQTYNDVTSKGVGIAELRGYPAYFEYQTEVIEGVQKRIAQTEEELAKCRQKLIDIMRDLKMLENLRQRQYEAYLAEVAAEQQKEIDDFVSYNVASTEDEVSAAEAAR